MLASTNYARTGLSFLSFNTERKPLDDLAVRQAIAYLADRDTITFKAIDGYGTKGMGYFGVGQWMYLLLNGTVQYPVKEPDENADAKTKLKTNAIGVVYEIENGYADVEYYCDDGATGRVWVPQSAVVSIDTNKDHSGEN